MVMIFVSLFVVVVFFLGGGGWVAQCVRLYWRGRMAKMDRITVKVCSRARLKKREIVMTSTFELRSLSCQKYSPVHS